MKNSYISSNSDASKKITPNIKNLQFVDNRKTEKVQYPVLGMSCASCSAHVQKILLSQKGVIHATVNLANATAYIEYNPDVISPEAMMKAVKDGGYELVIDNHEDEEIEDIRSNESNNLRKNTIAALILCIPLILVAMVFHKIPYANYIMWILATPVLFIFGAPFFKGAWKQLKHKTSNMDTLVALSTGIAYLFSMFNTLFPEVWTSRGMEPHVYFEVSAVVVAFVLLGRYLENRAKNKASDAIKELIGIQPKTATIISEGKSKEISIKDIKIGDEIVVKPGEKIAVDGKVIQGNSFVDESMINGEPLAIEKTIGDKVFSGTINQSGSFHFKAEKVGKDTLLAQIIKTVQEAQGSRAPIQNTVDKISSVFVPTIVIIAIITFFAWIFFGHDNNIPQGLLSAVTVLIIACPCALGLATPTAIVVGVGRGAKLGILIKDAQALETAKKITSIVLDKTGTITEGNPEIKDINWFIEETSQLRNILYSIETYSDHPLAETIKSKLKNDSNLITSIKVSNIAGKGLTADYNNEKYFIGNFKLIEENNIVINKDEKNWIDSQINTANTIVIFANEKQIIACISIIDAIKSTSIEAISELKANGLKVYMLTGDNEQSAQLIAQKVGINNVKANVLPVEKAAFIKELQAKKEIVAMVGDGINDSAALATADLSIAMGKGSDIAISVAQITIISSDLNKLTKAINLSKATVRTIKQNLFWAFIYNLIGVPLAAGVLYPINGFLLNPMIAGLAMALSSVCVVSNSLLLKSKKI